MFKDYDREFEIDYNVSLEKEKKLYERNLRMAALNIDELRK
jgi:hypothetical protein